MPEERVNGILISVYKGKGRKSVCSITRVTTLLEHIFSRFMLDRLVENVFSYMIPEELYDVRPKQGTMDMIFSARLVQEKILEEQI